MCARAEVHRHVHVYLVGSTEATQSVFYRSTEKSLSFIQLAGKTFFDARWTRYETKRSVRL